MEFSELAMFFNFKAKLNTFILVPSTLLQSLSKYFPITLYIANSILFGKLLDVSSSVLKSSRGISALSNVEVLILMFSRTFIFSPKFGKYLTSTGCQRGTVERIFCTCDDCVCVSTVEVAFQRKDKDWKQSPLFSVTMLDTFVAS